ELDAPLSFERDVAPVRLANVADAPVNGLPDVAVDPPVGVMLQGGVQVFTEAREEWLRGDLELLNQERRPGLSVLVGNLSNRNSPFLSYEEWHRAYRHDAGCLDDGHHPECVPLYAVFVRRLVTYRWRVLADAEMRMPAELKIEPGAEVHLYSKQHLIDFVQTEDDDLREIRKRRIRTLISLLKRSRSRGFEGLRVGLADNLPSLACQVKPFGGCVISRLHEPLPGRAVGSPDSEPQDWAPRLVQLQSIDASLPLTMRFRELFDEYVRPEDRQRDNVIAFLYEVVLGSPAILN
ncbi:MAG: hypothetical protein HY329_17485, partial [Chloroflexi bacterium]|nr:hypothetical protein [Chloroflexota bacterium]